MTWEALFDDLTSGLESEWEYERAAREAERQRLRIAQTTMHTRLGVLSASQEHIATTLRDMRVLTGEVVGNGADWVALRSAAASLHLIPETALVSVAAPSEAIRLSIPSGEAPEPGTASLAARMTFGYVARDLARRRVPVLIHATGGWQHHGTIDRAGVDHLDLAVHDRDVARRERAVRSVHMLGFGHITSISIEPSGLSRFAG